MLNKELLMGSSNEQRPVMVTVASFVDTGDNTNIGYSRQYFHIGEVDPLPYWVSEMSEPLYLRKLFKTPLQFRLARTSNCHAGQIAVTSLLKGTFEELP